MFNEALDIIQHWLNGSDTVWLQRNWNLEPGRKKWQPTVGCVACHLCADCLENVFSSDPSAHIE